MRRHLAGCGLGTPYSNTHPDTGPHKEHTMARYIWTWDGKSQEITLKRKTAKGYTFEYPANSTAAGNDWRMSQATFDHYVKIGAITIS